MCQHNAYVELETVSEKVARLQKQCQSSCLVQTFMEYVFYVFEAIISEQRDRRAEYHLVDEILVGNAKGRQLVKEKVQQGEYAYQYNNARQNPHNAFFHRVFCLMVVWCF